MTEYAFVCIRQHCCCLKESIYTAVIKHVWDPNMQAQMYDSMHHKGRTSMPQKAAAVFIIYHVQRTITAAASFFDDHWWSAAEVAGSSNY